MSVIKSSAVGLCEGLHCQCAYQARGLLEDAPLSYKGIQTWCMRVGMRHCRSDQTDCIPYSLFLQRGKLDVLVLVCLIVHRQVSIVVCKRYLYSVKCF